MQGIGVAERAEMIRVLFVDVDGVLTDGHVALNQRGEETSSFDVKDGLGLKMLMSAGVEVVIVTGRTSGAVAHRASELGITNLYQGVEDKGTVCRQFMESRGIPRTEAACMGDDLPDLAMFAQTGLSIAVADAAQELRQQADVVTRACGGRGAVREACEWILKQRGQWPKNGFTEISGG